MSLGHRPAPNPHIASQNTFPLQYCYNFAATRSITCASVSTGVGVGMAVAVGQGVAVGSAVGWGVAVGGTGCGDAVGWGVTVGGKVGAGWGDAVGWGVTVGGKVGAGCGDAVGSKVGAAGGVAVGGGVTVGRGETVGMRSMAWAMPAATVAGKSGVGVGGITSGCWQAAAMTAIAAISSNNISSGNRCRRRRTCRVSECIIAA